MSDKATEFQQYVKYVQNLNIDGIQLREELVAVDAVIDEGSERLSLLHEQREQVDKRLDQVKAQQNVCLTSRYGLIIAFANKCDL